MGEKIIFADALEYSHDTSSERLNAEPKRNM
jgi:hypothetical protein